MSRLTVHDHRVRPGESDELMHAADDAERQVVAGKVVDRLREDGRDFDHNDVIELARSARDASATVTALRKQLESRFQPVTLDDFYAYMPMHQYIFAPTGDMWPGSSVNQRLRRTATGGPRITWTPSAPSSA